MPSRKSGGSLSVCPFAFRIQSPCISLGSVRRFSCQANRPLTKGSQVSEQKAETNEERIIREGAEEGVVAESPEGPDIDDEDEVTPVTADDLSDIAKIVIADQEKNVSDYNATLAKVEAAQGDETRYVFNLRETSDDPTVVKFRKWLEETDAVREAAVNKVDIHIKKNLIGEPMTEDQVKAETARLKSLHEEVLLGEKLFALTTKTFAESGRDVKHLLPKIAEKEKTVRSGGIKPRFSGVYVNGVLASHVVKKEKIVVKNADGTDKIASTMSDAAKVMADKVLGKSDEKISIPDMQTAYFKAANVKPEDWQSGPDEVTFSFNVIGEKVPAGENFTIMVTK
jgi:hypothetical protein